MKGSVVRYKSVHNRKEEGGVGSLQQQLDPKSADAQINPEGAQEEPEDETAWQEQSTHPRIVIYINDCPLYSNYGDNITLDKDCTEDTDKILLKDISSEVPGDLLSSIAVLKLKEEQKINLKELQQDEKIQEICQIIKAIKKNGTNGSEHSRTLVHLFLK